MLVVKLIKVGVVWARGGVVLDVTTVSLKIFKKHWHLCSCHVSDTKVILYLFISA